MEMQKRIWDYLKGMRTGKIANGLEREALSDPFLFEALEGLEGVEARHEEIVTALEKQLRIKIKKQPKYTLSRWVLLAACVVVGGIACWLLYLPEEKMLMVERPEAGDSLVIQPFPVVAAVQEVEEKENVIPIENERKESKEISSGNTLVQEAVVVAMMEEEPQDYGMAEEEDHPQYEAELSRARAVMTSRKLVVKEIEGSVTDEEGKAIAGAVLMTKSKDIGTTTDADGHFHLEVPDTTKQLTVSFIGMESGEVDLSGSNRKKVVMKQDNRSLAECVVVGYGRGPRQKKSTSGSILLEDKGFEKYMADSLRYPREAVKQQISGEVILSVRLNKRGRASRIKVVKKLSPACDREAVRLVEAYKGRWQVSGKIFTVKVIFPPSSAAAGR